MQSGIRRPGIGVVLLAVGAMAGCASQPQASGPTTQGTPASVATSAVAAPVVVAEAAAPPAGAQASTASPAEAAFKPPPGFKARKRNGEVVYCRTVQVTGSQFPQEQCWPPDKLQAALEKQKESSQRLLRQQRGCRGSECVAAPPTR